MLHGFSRLQKWNLAKQVIDGREVDVAAQVGKKMGCYWIDYILFCDVG